MNDVVLRCGTWNVHRAKGSDGKVDAERVLRAINADLVPLGLDILALQEADEERRPHKRILDAARISALTGLTCAHDRPALRWGAQSDGFLGNILFLSDRFKRTHSDVIDLPGHCHRGAVSIETVIDEYPLRIMTLHLSLSQTLRIVQMRTIGQFLCRRPVMQTVMLGDFNEWRSWGGLMFHRRIVGIKMHGPAKATFPSKRPILPLDRILSDVPGAVSGVEIVSSGCAISASDHLPLTGFVKLKKDC